MYVCRLLCVGNAHCMCVVCMCMYMVMFYCVVFTRSSEYSIIITYVDLCLRVCAHACACVCVFTCCILLLQVVGVRMRVHVVLYVREMVDGWCSYARCV